MRAFLAIELPDPIRENLEGLAQRLRAAGVNASWVKPGNIHLTLRFLGEIDEGQVRTFCDILAFACRECPLFPLRVCGTGAFPNAHRPSVLWAGCEPLEGPLRPLQRIAEEAARAIGLPPETKAFHPHLTLARVKDWKAAGPVAEALEREKHFDAGEFEVSHVALFSSRLAPTGAVYSLLREFRFS